MSHARMVSQAEYRQRLDAAELAHDYLHVTRPRMVEAMWYETPIDASIAATELTIEQTRKAVTELRASAKRWLYKRGARDMAAGNLETMRGLLIFWRASRRDLAKLVAKRDAADKAGSGIPTAAQTAFLDSIPGTAGAPVATAPSVAFECERAGWVSRAPAESHVVGGKPERFTLTREGWTALKRRPLTVAAE